MRLFGKERLIKLKNKNIGNKLLLEAIDELIEMIESKQWQSRLEVKSDRPDADQVHPNGFYFFNLLAHRTMVMMQLGEHGEATIIWTGTHKQYESTFRNNKDVIRNWLRNKEWI